MAEAAARDNLLGFPVIALVCILFFVGAAGKTPRSALRLAPDAMAGPTPVSALIHAATMVTRASTWWPG